MLDVRVEDVTYHNGSVNVCSVLLDAAAGLGRQHLQVLFAFGFAHSKADSVQVAVADLLLLHIARPDGLSPSLYGAIC